MAVSCTLVPSTDPEADVPPAWRRSVEALDPGLGIDQATTPVLLYLPHVSRPAANAPVEMKPRAQTESRFFSTSLVNGLDRPAGEPLSL